MRRTVSLLSLTALVLVTATSAVAVPVSYTNRGIWLAAAGSVTNIDFEGIAPDNGFVDYSGPGLNLSGWHFDSYGNGPGNPPKYLLVVDDTYPNVGCGYDCYDWGSGAVLHGPPANGFGFGVTAPAGIIATFPTGASAVGTDIWSIFPDSQFFDVFVTTSDSVVHSFLNVPTPAGGPNNRGFIGFTSPTPIVGLRFEPKGVGTEGGSGGPYVDLDNFAYEPVPEPGTLILLGSGLTGMVVRRRRKQA
jgi:hypothetical protein